MSLHGRTLLCLATVLTIAGCTHATAPSAPTALYYLKSIGARPLPASAVAAPNMNSVTILAEGLYLDGIGIATRSRTVQGATPGSSQVVISRYAYTLSNDVLMLGDSPCGVADICVAHTPEQGTIFNGTLTLTAVTTGGVAAPAFVYQLSLPD